MAKPTVPSIGTRLVYYGALPELPTNGSPPSVPHWDYVDLTA